MPWDGNQDIAPGEEQGELTPDEWEAMVADQKNHASRHENDGSDELDVTGLSGVLADAQTPETEAVQDIVGALIQANGNLSVSYDDGANALTVDTTALNQEEVEDAVAGLVTAGSGITVNYDDAADSLSVGVDESALSFYDGAVLTADVDNESVSTGRTVIGGDGQTTPASEVNNLIQNTAPGSTIQFAGTIDGQVVISEDNPVNLIGAGIDIDEDTSNPFAAASVGGAVIDNSGSSGPDLLLDGHLGGIQIGNFAVASGGVRGAPSSESHNAGLMWSQLFNIYGHTLDQGTPSIDLTNPFKVSIDHCGGLRVGDGIRVANDHDTWNYGHVYLTNPVVDIDKSGGNAYLFESVNGQLDFIHLKQPHAISEGPATTNWTGYRFEGVKSARADHMTVEATDTPIYARNSSLAIDIGYWGASNGDIDDDNPDNVYVSHDQSNAVNIAERGRVVSRRDMAPDVGRGKTRKESYEAGDLTAYSGDTGSFSVAKSNPADGLYRLEGSGGGATAAISRTDTTVSRGRTYTMDVYLSSSSTTDGAPVLCVQSATGAGSISGYRFDVVGSGTMRIQRMDSGSGTLIASESISSLPRDEWCTLEMEMGALDSLRSTLYDANGGHVNTLEGTDDNSTPFESGGIGAIAYEDLYFDNLAER